MTHFLVQAGEFEGPFDVLLNLVEKKKLHISEISLSEIAQDYISFVKENELQLVEASRFIVIAATLMLIKSRSLLPTFALTNEEELEVEELQQRLQLFEVFTNVSKKIHAQFGKRVLYPRIYRAPTKKIVFRPDEIITPTNMKTALDEVFAQTPEQTFLPKKEVERQVSLKEVIETIQTRVTRFVRAHFSELVVGEDKKGTAVSFLAVLELFKQGVVDLRQEESFGTIMVEKNN